MIIETFEAGPVATNGYLVADKTGGVAVVIDAPQGASRSIVEQARKWNTPIAYLVSTHGHWDHVLDNAELLRLTGREVRHPPRQRAPAGSSTSAVFRTGSGH